MVLLPKGKLKYIVILLVEVIWKMIITIIHIRLRTAISLHDALHCFSQIRGAVTATLEAKLAQFMAVIFHEPLFQVLLGVNKAYES